MDDLIFTSLKEKKVNSVNQKFYIEESKPHIAPCNDFNNNQSREKKLILKKKNL